MPSRCRKGRSRVSSSGCIGPAVVQATFGRCPKMPVEIEVVRLHEAMRQRVQPQIGVRRRCRRCIEVDLDGHDVDRDRPSRIGDGEALEVLRRHRRVESERDRPDLRLGIPGVQDRAVCRGRREADAPHPSLIAHRSKVARVAACSVGSGDAAARPLRLLRRPHSRRSATSRASPAMRRCWPTRSTRRSGASRISTIHRDGDTIVARTDLGRDRRVVIAGHIDTVPINDNVPTRDIDRATASPSSGAAAPST